jgi:acyl-CoA dehydrogenase
MTEPEAGSDLRAMRTTAARDGDDYVIDGTKHFISKADIADYVILFAATGTEETARGMRQRLSAFLVDMGTPGLAVQAGYRSVSHRGYNNRTLAFDRCRVPARKLLGEEHRSLEVANTWLGAARLQVAAMCLGRAQRALELATEWAATRKQFGQAIGKFQGIGFQLADMATELAAAELLTLQVAWKVERGIATGKDPAMAKLYATEMLARVADRAVQIFGGMGVMEETPIARIWRDARVERIWDGTSEIQRHIISRELLRPYEH